MSKRGKSLTTPEGFVTVPMGDTTVQIYRRVGAYTPRLIEYEGDLWFDLRVFRANDDGALYPTRQAIRLGIKNTQRLYKALRLARKFLVSQGVWEEEG